jgi:hypothetical protein
MDNLITQFPIGMPVHHPYHGNGEVVGYYEVGDSGPHLIVQFVSRNGRNNFKLIMRKSELRLEPVRRRRSRSRSGNRNRGEGETRRRNRSGSRSGRRG